MATKLYVGGLAYSVNDSQLNDFFSTAGTVVSASVILDKFSNQSKGFGFVEMSSEDEAKEAIKQLNEKELDGRKISVNEARPREDRPSGLRGHGNSQGGYGGGRRR
ncbi:MAG TPA: RNA-binding protein [Candidatus Saccharimonadales bacterium]|nr:RNA-binding protein [Candidatus Saccharimonadales bacterium]